MENNIDYKEFFLNNNKSGWKTCESKLKNRFYDLHNDIINYCEKNNLIDFSFKEKIWFFINDEKTQPKCLECNTLLKFGKSLNNGYGKYCSLRCTNMNDNHKEKVKETNKSLYGGVTPFFSEEVKSKSKKTNIERYGVDNVMKLDRVKSIFKNGSLKKYNTEYPAQSKSSKIRVENKEKYLKLNILNNENGCYSVNCDICNNVSDFNNNELNYRFKNEIPICKICADIKNNVSYPENEIINFIESLNIYTDKNNRKILNGKELDIYIPSHNIAIEYNGLYWHSEIYKDDNYHLNKTELCENEGIKLIHIFEDEWLHKKDITKSRLSNILGLSKIKIFGRKCVVKEVSSKNSREFLELNHIQGNVNSSIKLGLYYDDELVSLMTFGGLRKSMGSNHKEGVYELLRFCNKLNSSVIGGADKLLKHFIKTHNPKEIISYADRRWSQGDLYEKLGFSKSNISKPNYFYINNTKRENRFTYRKDVLVKQGYSNDKTEHEIMLERGIYRVYDCGNLKYIKKI